MTQVQKMTNSQSMLKLSRKERERLKRRELILDVAEETIIKHGFENATMDEIAEKAEVAKGTLYNHFESKTHIYIAICERGSSKLNEQMAKVLTQDLSGLKMVEELGNTYLNFVMEHTQYFHAFNYYEGVVSEITSDSDGILQQCKMNTKEAMTFIVRALQIGMQDGSIDDSYEPRELGLIIWGASKGIINMVFLKQSSSGYEFLNEVDFEFESIMKNFIHLIGTGLIKK